MIETSYVPVMLAPGWVLERYYGWSVLYESSKLKLLKKNHGAIASFLLLSRCASDDDILNAARQHSVLRRLSIVVLNDFSNHSTEGSRSIDGVGFERVTTERWFGFGTFVLDLSDDLDALWRRMAPREKTKCRKVARVGTKVEFHERPSKKAIDDFLELYGRMARKRGLEKPSRDMLHRMFAQGDLLMARCIDSAGRTLVINLTYLCGGQGYYIYGTRSDDIMAGAAHYTQWETIKRLKDMRCRWYDLGLVPNRDPSNGIYRFKASFGGTFVDSGSEFRRVPWQLAAAYRIFRSLRKGFRGLSGGSIVRETNARRSTTRSCFGHSTNSC